MYVDIYLFFEDICWHGRHFQKQGEIVKCKVSTISQEADDCVQMKANNLCTFYLYLSVYNTTVPLLPHKDTIMFRNEIIIVIYIITSKLKNHKCQNSCLEYQTQPKQVVAPNLAQLVWSEREDKKTLGSNRRLPIGLSTGQHQEYI